jgi:hypothetical protein
MCCVVNETINPVQKCCCNYSFDLLMILVKSITGLKSNFCVEINTNRLPTLPNSTSSKLFLSKSHFFGLAQQKFSMYCVYSSRSRHKACMIHSIHNLCNHATPNIYLPVSMWNHHCNGSSVQNDVHNVQTLYRNHAIYFYGT